MINFRPTYEPIIKFCKELIAEKKALMEENEELKETLRCLRQDNQELRDKLFSKPKDERLADLEKRVADLEQGKKLFLLDDNSTPIKSFTLTGKLTVIDEPTEEKLEVGKWYDARKFDEATLKKLLPVGTLVEITTNLTTDERVTESPKVGLETSRVTKVVAEDNIVVETETVVYVERYTHVSCYWFKILKEN